MKYKILILSFTMIVLIGSSAFLASISVNPTNTSSANAKREYTSTLEILKDAVVQSESKIIQQTLTLRNAKRENTNGVSFMNR